MLTETNTGFVYDPEETEMPDIFFIPQRVIIC